MKSKANAKKYRHRDPYIIANCSPHAAISIDDEYLVSLTDDGNGKLHKLTSNLANITDSGAGI